MSSALKISSENPIVNIPQGLYQQLVEPFLDITDLIQLAVVSTEFHQLTSNAFREKIGWRIIRMFHIRYDDYAREHCNIIRINHWNMLFDLKLKPYIKKLIDFFIPQLFRYIQKEKIDRLYLESYSSGPLMEISCEITNKEEKIQQIFECISANETLKECNIGLFEIFRDPNWIGRKLITEIVQHHPTLKYFDLKSSCHGRRGTTFLHKRDDGSVVWR